MYVVNIKLNLKKVLIVLIIIILTVTTILKFSSTSKIISLNTSEKSGENTNYDYNLTDENFLSVLKEIHENIDSNLGKTVKLTGFVFRMPDFKEDYFVCGRNTIINNEDIVAGFLCKSDQENSLIDNEWIEITGVIVKGEYNTVMPVIQVGSIKKVTAPANTFVQN
jgi:uncharacterized repeat protein (TIGR03943 family)